MFEYYIATNSMKPPAFDIGYGVYRSFYFTEYVPPPPPKKCQTSKNPNETTDDEEPSNFYYYYYFNGDLIRLRGVHPRLNKLGI